MALFRNPETYTKKLPNRGEVVDVINQRLYVNPSEETLKEIGFEEIVEEERPDERFYLVRGPYNDGHFDATPKDLDALKAAYSKEQLKIRNNALKETDWLIVRHHETSKAIPSNATNHRAAVRSVYATNVANIENADSLEALKTVLDEILQSYPLYQFS